MLYFEVFGKFCDDKWFGFFLVNYKKINNVEMCFKFFLFFFKDKLCLVSVGFDIFFIVFWN